VARALGAYFRAAGIQPSLLRVRRGQYDWAQLERWQAGPGSAALAVPGAVFTDADEASNRLRIGVEHGAAAAGVRSALARAGVPAAAVIIEETTPIVRMATLQNDNGRQGGLQINFPGFLCTLGFNDGTGAFITNSHCTTTQGGVENTPYGQPLLSAGTVAIEVTTRRTSPAAPAPPAAAAGAATPPGPGTSRASRARSVGSRGPRSPTGSETLSRSPGRSPSPASC
jgi:hypothetical protein